MTAEGEFWVTPEVRQGAERAKARLMSDPAWVAKYLAGDVAAQELMLGVNMRLVAEIKAK
jgi:hypothetical protein